MILNNLFIETLRRKEISKCDAVGDGTGYSLTVTKHYRSMGEKHGESVKKGQFVYSFALMDLNTRMYIGYAVSMKSERDAYMKALEMIAKLRIELESIRLDRYYSGQSILDDFSENTRIFIMPKKNFRIRGCNRRSRFVQNRRCKIDPPHIFFHSLFSPLLSVGREFFFLSLSL
jgi:transposase